MNFSMFYWLTSGYNYVACADAYSDFVVACSLKAISISYAILRCMWSCVVASWALMVRGRTRRVRSSLTILMINIGHG